MGRRRSRRGRGAILPSGTGGTGGTGGTAGTSSIGVGGSTTGVAGTGGSAGAIGAGGAAGDSGLSVDPSAATFAGTLVEAVSAAQTFTVRNGGSATAGTTAALAAAFGGPNAADFLVTSNGCGTTLQPGTSCELAVAFAPKTRSGARSASLTVGAPSGPPATVSLSGTALPSLGFLAGGLGGPGDLNGTGAAVRFYRPGSVASDGAGNLYIADNHTIRKFVIATGAVTTFAGAPGQTGGADGTGAAARFYGPRCLFSDGSGTLYVTDNYTLRKMVIATGAVTTFAGAAGEAGSADGTGAAARFYGPACMASDGAGNLYVTDSGNGTIRKVVIATGAVTTFAGAPGSLDSVDGIGAAARFFSPGGIISDGAGILYVADTNNRTIRKVVIATRAVTTLAGAAGPDNSVDGTGTAARFVGPSTIASDGAGNLYVTDSNAFGGVIRKIVIATAAVTTFAGTPFQEGRLDGTGAAARFESAAAIAGDGAGNLYVTDSMGFGGTIRRVAIATATVTTVAGATQQIGSADGTGASARFNLPDGIATDGAGNLFVADTSNGSVRKVVIATGAVTTLGGGGGGFYEPSAIATDGAGNVYVSDGGRLLRKIAVATGAVTTLAGQPDDPYPGYVDGVGTAARFSGLVGIASDGGNLYVADANNNCIRKVVIATGAVTTFAGAKGQSVVADGTGAGARFHNPYGIASDGAGNLFVADSNTIRKVVIATGAVTTLAGVADQPGSADGTGAAARFSFPSRIASDGAGNLYVADANTVRKVGVEAGTVSTIIGSNDRLGVSLGALPASLNHLRGVVVLPTGELAIVDSSENAILIGHL